MSKLDWSKIDVRASNTVTQSNEYVEIQGDIDDFQQCVEPWDHLIMHCPTCAKPLHDVLGFCAQVRSGDEVVERMRSAQGYPKTFIMQPAAFLDLCVKYGLLSLAITVDGVAYEGNAEDLQRDEKVSDTAQVIYAYETTEDGRAYVTCSEPSALLEALVDEEPAYRETYRRALELGLPGISRDDLRDTLLAEGLVPIDERTGLVSVFWSYFVGRLEKASGMAWDGERWNTTEAGAAFYETL